METRAPLFTLAVATILAAACSTEPPGVGPGSEDPAMRPFLAAAAKVGDPLDGLTPEERDLFQRGLEVFDRVFTPENGLGPLFNADACGECHEDPVAGGPGDEVEVHATAFHQGRCDELIEQGGPVIQQQATPALQAAMGIEREPVPAAATGTGLRTTPDLFGFGLLDAVPDEAILALADPDDRDGDGISGRPNRTADGRLGRFGRKASVATLAEFNNDAFVQEQGITNPAFPDEGTIGPRPIPKGVDPTPDPEIDQEALDLMNAFVRLLAPPRRGPQNREAAEGAEVFQAIGCAGCHVPELTTGDSPTAALRNRTVAAYTDMLLHDMGPALADICRTQAEPAEFRTEPLMGLTLSETFLHDGRATTIEQAIELHGGEATGTRDRFLALSARARAALVAFLESL